MLHNNLYAITRLIVVFLLITAGRSHAGAEFGLTGHDILDLCESEVDADKAVCAYYIAGISGGFAQSLAMSGEQPYYCLPMGIRLYQLPKLYEQFAYKKPELLDYPADSFIAHMLKSSFPCTID